VKEDSEEGIRSKCRIGPGTSAERLACDLTSESKAADLDPGDRKKRIGCAM
jgi:hypothetical protein